MPNYKRGDIWIADLDPVVGSEQGKTRPVVIIQNDVANLYSPVVIVAAVTTSIGVKEYPTEVIVTAPEAAVKRDSAILLNQIRTIDKRRLVEYWGRLNPSTMERVDTALKISLGLVPV
ncbi:MAG: type II toxin-antitoxin system PemK/MazF family toxin [Candidatus Bipolaricaulota bacterium]|nr:type II toxin-antitoxin system PemK/MazF family toxin [Candidatus Bipolaricaulota bacterium]